MNCFNFTGRVTKDSELSFIPNSGTAVLKYTVAADRNMKRKDGSRETDFFDCVMFGKSAEGLAPYIVKGTFLAITGEMQTRSYEAKDGSKRKVYEVKVDHVSFVGGSSEGSGKNTYKGVDGKQHEELFQEVDNGGDVPW